MIFKNYNHIDSFVEMFYYIILVNTINKCTLFGLYLQTRRCYEKAN